MARMTVLWREYRNHPKATAVSQACAYIRMMLTTFSLFAVFLFGCAWDFSGQFLMNGDLINAVYAVGALAAGGVLIYIVFILFDRCVLYVELSIIQDDLYEQAPRDVRMSHWASTAGQWKKDLYRSTVRFFGGYLLFAVAAVLVRVIIYYCL